MAQKFTFEIVTPTGVAFSEDIYEAVLPTPDGEVGILPGHAPMYSLISTGIATLRRQNSTSDEAMEFLAVTNGFVEITKHSARVFADTAERAEDIDELKAKEALEQAEKLKQSAADQVSLADATGLIEQQMTRLKVAGLRRRHKRN